MTRLLYRTFVLLLLCLPCHITATASAQLIGGQTGTTASPNNTVSPDSPTVSTINPQIGVSDTKRLETDLRRLDKVLDTAEEYVHVKELRISTIENTLSSRGTTRLQQYNIYGDLYEEYASFQFDKAMDMLFRQEQLADEMESLNLKYDVLLEKAMLYVMSGLHLEADKLLHSMDTTRFTPGQKVKWNDVQLKFIIDYAEYLGHPAISNTEMGKVGWLQQQIMSSIPEDSPEYVIYRVTALYREKRFAEALAANMELIETLSEESHDYAIAAYWMGVIYDNMGALGDAIHWWVESAICDVRMATKDNASLYSIAMNLSDLGETERAFRYTQVSLDDAIFYNSVLRRVQIASTLPWIEKAYTDSQREQQNRLRTFIFLLIVSTAVMAVVMAVAIFFFVKMRRISIEASEKNRQLEIYSSSLEAAENSLKDTNQRLIEANTAKEEYIGLFLSQSSSYLDKLKKLMSRDQYEEELKNFYKNFDTSFLGLYPTFIQEFNSLLQEDARIHPKEKDRLSIELRIFALIKLGITQSSHIASLLRYSVNTIYNYRAQVKNSALGDRDNFEDRVKKIGQKS